MFLQILKYFTVVTQCVWRVKLCADVMQAVMITLTFPLIDVEMQNVFANTKMYYSCNTVRVEGEVVCGCNTER